MTENNKSPYVIPLLTGLACTISLLAGRALEHLNCPKEIRQPDSQRLEIISVSGKTNTFYFYNGGYFPRQTIIDAEKQKVTEKYNAELNKLESSVTNLGVRK